MIEWEPYEGGVLAVTEGAEINIDAAQNQAQCAKWGETYTPGRRWSVYFDDGQTVSGQADNLREAKKASLAAVRELTA